MRTPTSYSRGDAGGMQRYMKSDEGIEVKVKNSTGEEITKQERADFTEKCNNNDIWRSVVLAPDNSVSWSRDELERGTRKTMSKLKEERPSIDYQYAVHDEARDATELFASFARQLGNDPGLTDEEREQLADYIKEIEENKPKDHAHVIMTGEKEDMEMWEEDGDMEELREIAADSFNEGEKLKADEMTEKMENTMEESFSESETMGMAE